jgi:tetratricopeptide (TPR) repeat protein
LQWAEFESAYLSIAPGDLDKAAEAMQAGLEVNRRGGYPHFAAYYTAHLGWLARLRGDDEEAMTLGRRAVDIAEQHEQPWWQATACAMLGGTLLQAGDRAAATALFERGLTAAQQAGAEAYLLHCTARLAAAAGSPAMLADADRLLGQADIPAGGAWLLGEETYLALAQAWLDREEPDRARAAARAGRAGAVDADADRGARRRRARPNPAGRAGAGADAAAAGRAAGRRAWLGARPGGSAAGHPLPRWRPHSNSARHAAARAAPSVSTGR